MRQQLENGGPSGDYYDVTGYFNRAAVEIAKRYGTEDTLYAKLRQAPALCKTVSPEPIAFINKRCVVHTINAIDELFQAKKLECR